LESKAKCRFWIPQLQRNKTARSERMYRNFPGCAAHGATQEDALANAQDAIRLWIDTAKEFGDPVPQLKGRRLILA